MKGGVSPDDNLCAQPEAGPLQTDSRVQETALLSSHLS